MSDTVVINILVVFVALAYVLGAVVGFCIGRRRG